MATRTASGGFGVRDEAFRELVESIEDYAIYLLDAEGRVLTWNRGCERIKGYRASEIVGRSFEAFYPEEDRQGSEPRRQLETAAAKGHHAEEGWRVRKDGTRFWAALAITALRDDTGRVYGFAKVTRDLTDARRAAALLLDEQIARARAEESARRASLLARVGAALAASSGVEATLRALADLVVGDIGDYAVVVYRVHGDQRIAVAHADPAKAPLVMAAQRAFPPHGVPCRIPDAAEPIKVHQITRDMVAAAVGSTETAAAEAALEPASCMIAPLRSLAAGVVGSLSIVSCDPRRLYGDADLAVAADIAERASLALENARLYEEQARARRGAEAAVQARDEFISVASHELRTPIAALRLNVEGVQRLLARAEAEASGGEAQGLAVAVERVRQRVETSIRQVDRLERLVAALLDVTRLAEGRLQMIPERVDLVALATEVSERFEGQLARDGTSLVIEAPRKVTGMWDRARLDQVITNLVGNAVKYGRGRPIRVCVSTDETGSFAVLRVADEGIGIAAEDQSRIFDRFERAAPAKHFGGLGLGLWITRRVVEAMHGTISVDSAPESGASFIVRLPVALS